MSYKLVISSLAHQEASDALNYYLGSGYTIAERFLKALESAYNRLEETPQHYTYFGHSKKIRRLALKDFPFAVLYRIQVDEVIIRLCSRMYDAA